MTKSNRILVYLWKWIYVFIINMYICKTVLNYITPTIDQDRFNNIWINIHGWVLIHGTNAVLTLSRCTLAGPVYTGMSMECHWLTQCTLGYHWATQRILPGYTGTPLEKLSWNSPTLECHLRDLVESTPHWDATGGILTFAAYTGAPQEGLWQPTHAPTHIVNHAE